MIKKLAGLVLAIFCLAPAPMAFAHGEDAQESFLRMGTIAFWDVKSSVPDGGDLKQGEELKLTGTAKILETWPQQLATPELGFITIVAPGPVVTIKERTINGKPAPDAIEVHKGGVYEFSMTLVGRRVGKWHIHPIFGVHGAGSLLGPGSYVNVTESPGGYVNTAQLTNGETIDMEGVGLGGLTFWAIVWGIVGLAWLLYWIVPNPTVTRLAVTSQIPLNTDGGAHGLITKKDHRAMNLMMALTVVLLAGGWIYQSVAYPDKMPQQVLRFDPGQPAAVPAFVTAKANSAVYDQTTDTVRMKVSVHNTGSTPATLQAFTTSTLTFPTKGVASPVNGRIAEVDDPVVAPGETKELTIDMRDPVWSQERLMPVNQSRLEITGVLRLEEAGGDENELTVQSFVTPEKIST
jgi:methane/ammonia monooxygenase subunit B